jgi:hypothetical protein
MIVYAGYTQVHPGISGDTCNLLSGGARTPDEPPHHASQTGPAGMSPTYSKGLTHLTAPAKEVSWRGGEGRLSKRIFMPNSGTKGRDPEATSLTGHAFAQGSAATAPRHRRP